MGTYRELPVLHAASQSFSTYLVGRRCLFDLHWNETANRWFFGLTVDDVLVLAGRRIIVGVDLLEPFDLHMGALIAVDWEGKHAEPDREALPAGRIRLLHYEDAEVDE